MAVTTKVNAKRLLADVPEQKWFCCHDGKPLENMAELDMALKQMTDETFRYHLNQDSSPRAQAARYVSYRISQIKRQTATR